MFSHTIDPDLTSSTPNDSPQTAKASTSTAQKTPDHLNSAGCRIEYSEEKGRGVYASRAIRSQTVIEISPVLLFTNEEYEAHGRHTVLHHYTFKWRDGRMALALGLGSLFNHSHEPNVSYTIDPETESIRYMTIRTVPPGEELCIFYGHKLWFRPATPVPENVPSEDIEDGWGGLSVVVQDEEALLPEEDVHWPLLEGDPNDIIPEHQLPFTRLKLILDEEEDELSAIRTEQAWVVDIPDQRQITTMLKWLKQSSLENTPLSHLKRIRRDGETSTLLLAPTSTYPCPPTLPDDVELPKPYTLAVPRTAALTPTSLKVKCTLWPTIYTPRRKGEMEEWPRGRLRWAWDAMRTVVREAKAARARGELPIVAYVPPAYDEEARAATQLHTSLIAHDTRVSSSHPLRHAVLNVVREVAEYRASRSSAEQSPAPLTPSIDVPATSNSTPSLSVGEEVSVNGDLSSSAPRSGAHYLLTSLTLFVSHEPCIMCSMALLHSRVKEIFYLVPMEQTGGCGGVACVPRLEGVNHRFGISIWKDGEGALKRDKLEIEPWTDA